MASDFSDSVLSGTSDDRSSALDTANALIRRLRSDLERRSAEFEALFDLLPVALYLAEDPQCHTIRTNAAGVRLLSMSSNTILHRPEDGDRAAAYRAEWDGREIPLDEMPLQAAVFSGRPVSGITFDIVRKNGARHHIQGSAVPIRNAHGQVVGGIAVYLDVTGSMDMEAAFRESEDRFKSAFEFAPIGMALVRQDGRFLRVNHALCAITGYAAEELLKLDFQAITHPDDLEKDLASFRAMLSGDIRYYEMEKRYIHKAGKIIWILLTVSLARGVDGRPLHFISQIQDITKRKEAEELLAREAEKLAEAQRVARIGSWEFDVATGRIAWSEEMYRLLELDETSGEITYETFTSHCHPEDVSKLNTLADQALLDGEPYELDVRMILGNGESTWLHAIGRGEKDAAGKVVRLFGTLMDVTERKRAQETIRDYSAVLQEKMAELQRVNAELADLATSDGLTGLLNHRAFHDRLTEEFAAARRQGGPLSLIMLDVDRFKQYNDTFGHVEGDKALKRLGRILLANARGIDIVGRYGGEEFALILRQTDLAGALIVAERIRASIEATVWKKRSITVSLGVSSLGPGTEGVTDLIVLADKALYQSKAKGRNTVSHSAS